MQSFNAYHSYLESIELLSDAERGRLFTALLIYSSSGTLPRLKGNERYVFPHMRCQIDRDRLAYEAKCRQNAENGRKGGRPRLSDPARREPRCDIPSLEEVRSYCRERHSSIEPEKFYDYFQAGGWRDSRGLPVLNWRQKLQTWETYGPERPAGTCSVRPDINTLKKKLEEI